MRFFVVKLLKVLIIIHRMWVVFILVKVTNNWILLVLLLFLLSSHQIIILVKLRWLNGVFLPILLSIGCVINIWELRLSFLQEIGLLLMRSWVIEEVYHFLVFAHEMADYGSFLVDNRLLVNELRILVIVLLQMLQVHISDVGRLEEVGGIRHVAPLVEGLLLPLDVSYLEVYTLAVVTPIVIVVVMLVALVGSVIICLVMLQGI